jgi:hypothetical protein
MRTILRIMLYRDMASHTPAEQESWEAEHVGEEGGHYSISLVFSSTSVVENRHLLVEFHN